MKQPPFGFVKESHWEPVIFILYLGSIFNLLFSSEMEDLFRSMCVSPGTFESLAAHFLMPCVLSVPLHTSQPRSRRLPGFHLV